MRRSIRERWRRWTLVNITRMDFWVFFRVWPRLLMWLWIGRLGLIRLLRLVLLSWLLLWWWWLWRLWLLVHLKGIAVGPPEVSQHGCDLFSALPCS